MKNDRLPVNSLRQFAAITCFFLIASTMMEGPVFSQKGASAKTPPGTATQVQSLPLLIDVGADKCIPCIKMAPILEELKNEYAGVLQVVFVDVWKKPEEARKYQVRGIPTQIFYDASGKELGRHMGFIGKEDILKGFEQMGIPLRKPSRK